MASLITYLLLSGSCTECAPPGMGLSHDCLYLYNHTIPADLSGAGTIEKRLCGLSVHHFEDYVVQQLFRQDVVH